ncbi:tetratricopeptide repeat protein [Edaphobacter modestus]|uniref:Tetratricopeptide repeat protein n=2 Tax=Edaphobacter modestus TaxID=388466 RepID=A0A4Q7YZS2_9BACT|nr:tetratricopeptide repeat protein [Edaphobacter modestus]
MKLSFMSRRVGRVLIGALTGASAVCFLIGARTPTAYANNDPAQPSQRKIYSQSVTENYNYRFGADHPFLPSLAATDTGEFINPKAFPTAKYCGHCHQEAHAEWRQSAHANSFRTPWYTRNVNLLTEEKGVEFTRHCEGCHNPTALTSGALTKGSPVNRKFDEDGVTCSVCHAIQKVDTRGTGSYVLAQPAVMVDEQGTPIYGEVSDKQILTHLDLHSKAVMKDFYRTSEYCSACHKAALPKQLNDYKWQRAIFLYDEWQQSSFAKQSPLPFYTKDAVSNCQTCHMPREELTLSDSGAKDGKLASHRWLGANTIMSKFYNYDVQMEKTVAFLRNNVFNIDLFGLEKNGGAMTAPVGTEPISIAAGDTVTVSVIIQNKGIAHSHVPEQRDMYESWVEFEAKDSSGRILSHSGGLEANGDLDPRAHSFTNRLINAKGEINALHQVWDNRVVAYNNTIASGRSQIVRYQFRIPPNAKSPISVTARVNYRRFDQHFMDFAMQTQHYPQPIVDMASRTRTFQLGANPATPPDPADNPLWMRWNNYGIAMLDAQQYAESVRAFEQVAKLRPDYTDAYTNIAIASFQWQRYDDSRTNLDKALKLSPHNARALYYLALVERNQGNLDSAISDLREVITQFPRSRDAHRELGFSLYQQHKYDEARAEYETLQTIDPDDLAAHYILSIVYRRLGMTEKASYESAMFADQKDDPTASTYALEFLRRHTDVANETVPWHTHSDLTPESSQPKQGGMAAQ